MSPSNVVSLPKVLPSTALSVGQLLSTPFAPTNMDGESDGTYSSQTSPPPTQAIHENDMIYRTLQSPTEAFEATCEEPHARSWLQSMAASHKPVYFVVGVQEHFSDEDEEQPVNGTALPPPITRRDSELSTASTSSHVSGVELRRVQVRIGRRDEPHSIDDLKWSWTYHPLNGGQNGDGYEQLAIGLGGSANPDEVMSL